MAFSISTATSHDYIKLLESLYNVHAEVGTSPPHKEDIEALKEPQNQELIARHAPLNIKETLSKVSYYSLNLLFAYEAAARVRQNSLARECAQKWTKDFNEEIKREIEKIIPCQGFFSHARATEEQLQELDESFKRLSARLTLPNFLEPDSWKYILQQKIHTLGQEILLCAKNSPEWVFVALSSDAKGALKEEKVDATDLKNNAVYIKKIVHEALSFDYLPTIEQSALLYRYRYQAEEASVKQMEYLLTEERVAFILKNLPCLKKLDLTGCLNLTAKCLADGHALLEVLILDQTEITPEQIDKKKFPSLKEVVNASPQKILRLKASSKTSRDWKDLEKNVQRADVIFIEQNVLDSLFAEFKKDPSKEKLQALNCLRLSSKLRQERFFDPFPIEERFIEAILDAWKTLPESRWEKETIGDTLCKFLLRLVGDKASLKTTRDSILKAICHELKGRYEERVEERWKNKIIQKDNWRYLSDVTRARSLLRHMRNFHGNYTDQMIASAYYLLNAMDRELLVQQSAQRIGYTQRELLVDQIELQTEILVELSHQKKETQEQKETNHLLWAMQTLLKDPRKAAFRKEFVNNDSLVILNLLFSTTHKAGPFYGQTINHSLACAFAIKLSKIHREKVLETILQEFKEFPDNTTIYPLPKLIVGDIQAEDVPEWDRDSVLFERLQQYKGVFAEEISLELKEKYFQALCNGEFGKTVALVSALKTLYQRKETSEKGREAIKDALRSLGGWGYKGHLLFEKKIYFAPSVNDVEKAAREALEHLGIQ